MSNNLLIISIGKFWGNIHFLLVFTFSYFSKISVHDIKSAMCITSSMWAFYLQTYYNFDTSESARNVMAHVTPVLTTAGLVNTGFNPGTVIVITWSNMFGKVTEGCADVYNNQVNQDDAVTCIHRITDLLWWEFMEDRVDNFWTTDHSTIEHSN